MDLSFAKDTKIFSKAVEELRAESADLTDAEVIKERYEKLSKGSKKKAEKPEKKESKPKKKAPKSKK